MSTSSLTTISTPASPEPHTLELCITLDVVQVSIGPDSIVWHYETSGILVDNFISTHTHSLAWFMMRPAHARSFAIVDCDPAVMGIGPTVAIPAVVKATGLKVQDVDLFGINELDPQNVNVNGGAIALRPSSWLYSRCVATLLNEMKCGGRDYRFGVISMYWDGGCTYFWKRGLLMNCIMLKLSKP